MAAERWKLLQDLIHQACALDPLHRQEFINLRCAGDAELKQQLEELVSEDLVTQGALDESTPLPTGDLGPYRFVRLLGEGGMGAVYQAQHRETEQMVAIKMLRSGQLSVASQQRFATEKRALAQLNHPSIARLYASEQFRDGTPCFVMEYVEGESLTHYCGRLHCSLRERAALFRQVCEAVQHAHEHGVIHRDLKPSNIMVTADGTVRLLDFGSAKLLDAPEAATATNLQRAPMTLGYAAPRTGD
jgi:serine/threonine protein kinase